MSRSTLPARTRRRITAAAFVVALPLTMAVACEDEGTGESGVEQEEEGVEQEEEGNGEGGED